MPILVDSVGGVECNVVGSVIHGDHTVFVGEVQSAYLNNDVDFKFIFNWLELWRLIFIYE